MDAIKSLGRVLATAMLPGLALGQVVVGSGGQSVPARPVPMLPGAATPLTQPPMVQPRQLNIDPAVNLEDSLPSAMPIPAPNVRRGERGLSPASIRSQLSALDSLARRGLISLEEYRERQQQILRGY